MSDNLAERLLKYPTAIGRFFIVIINNVYCIPTYVIWMGLLIPLKRINPDYYYKIEGLFFHWLLAVVSMWSYSAGYDIVEVGDNIEECRNKRTLVMANHQSTADVPLLMANFNAKENILPNIMWIMDRLFKFTNFGIVSVIHQDFFISSGRDKRDESINSLKTHLKNSFIKRNRNWMVLFPEGGFLRKRRAVSQRYAEKNNLPLLEYVTLPRVGALKAIVDVMCDENNILSTKSNRNLINLNSNRDFNNRDILTTNSNNFNYINNDNKLNNKILLQTSESSIKTIFNDNNDDNKENKLNMTDITTTSKTNTNAIMNNEDILANGDSKDINSLSQILTNNNKNKDCLLDYVLDITIAYPNGIPLDLSNIVHGFRDPCKTYMLYRLFKVKDIPKENEALTNWLYQRFVEKNDLLEKFYKTGEFYSDRILNSTAQVIQQDYLRFILINIFFITSTYFHYQLFTTLYTYCYYLTHGVS